MHGDGLLAIADRRDDLDRARQHHEEPRVLLAGVEQHLARPHVAAVADAGDAFHLGGVNRGNICSARGMVVGVVGVAVMPSIMRRRGRDASPSASNRRVRLAAQALDQLVADPAC